MALPVFQLQKIEFRMISVKVAVGCANVIVY